MFLHVSVILSTGGKVCPIACWDTTPPPERQTPWQGDPPWQGRPPRQGDPLLARQTPPVHAGRHDQHAGSMHPTGMQSCRYYFNLRWHLINEFLLMIFMAYSHWRTPTPIPNDLNGIVLNCWTVDVAEWLARLTAELEVSCLSLASYLCWNMHVGKATGHYTGHLHQQKCCTRGQSQWMYIT